MCRLAFCILFLFYFLSFKRDVVAQKVVGINSKPIVDSSAYDNWPIVDIGSGKISNDGRYMSFAIRNLDGDVSESILKECKGNWILRMQNVSNVEFSADSRMAIYSFKDTLRIIKLGTSNVEKIPHVKSFQFKLLADGKWISYGVNDRKELILRNLIDGRIKIYEAVNKYMFSDDGRVVVLESNMIRSGDNLQTLNIVNISNDEMTNIWVGKGLTSFVLNTPATGVAFMVYDSINRGNSIWFNKIGESKSSLLVNDSISYLKDSLLLGDLQEVSADGRYIFYTLRSLDKQIIRSDKKSDVNIWSYLDENLPVSHFSGYDPFEGYLAAVNCADRNITIITHNKQRVSGRNILGNIFLIENISGNGDESERSWNATSQKKYVVKCLDKKEVIPLIAKVNSLIELSPEGKFIVYYNKEENTYYSYEVASGIYRNLTSGIDVSWINYYKDDMMKLPRGLMGWERDDKFVYIYDRFDLWKIDPLGVRPPSNVTNGYGLRNSIIFNIGLPPSLLTRQVKDNILILNALNLRNKQNGFFKKVINKLGDPDQLIMSDAIYHFVDNPYVNTRGSYPIKAKDAQKYIVVRMKGDESPNFFYTEDFKSFIRQSNVRPETHYNWYSTELVNWQAPDEHTLQGVLYKPENFDSTKKYPVIFYYYEKKSFSLNEYLFPRSLTGGCNINIPSVVSNGYLVFTPDIDYAIGDPMQGTYDALVSAAWYLSKLPFIDGKRMGIGGCSWGGIQTNYLVTHTNIFAAAYSSSSMSDLISAYGDAIGGGLHHLFEEGHLRMGGTLWEKRDQYIKASAIFNADKTTTPLLLMHTTDDGTCSFSQALELFTALRRLGKRVWLLEYPYGNHGVSGDFAKDFSIRLSQFFDHYLKGSPPPEWMTKSSDELKHKGDRQYRLDMKVKTPGRGLIIDPFEKDTVEK